MNYYASRLPPRTVASMRASKVTAASLTGTLALALELAADGPIVTTGRGDAYNAHGRTSLRRDLLDELRGELDRLGIDWRDLQEFRRREETAI